MNGKRIILLIGFILVLIICITYFVIDSFFVGHISLDGGRFYTVNYGSKYREKGYSATYNGIDVSKYVKIKSNVNTKKIGNYRVVYTLKKGLYTKKIVRNVYVRDIEKPSINLDSLEDIYICPNNEFVLNNNYSVTDNYDGDITDKLRINISKNHVTYEIEDSSKNYNRVIRNIKYVDNIKPNIELIGSDNLTVYIGDEYEELGYKAMDNCDLDITKNVVIDGSVDTKKVGKYELIYKISDKSNNENEVKRIVNVINKPVKGVVYLTFDDGPQEGTTNVILDILKEEGVKATFFVTSKGPDSLIKREYDEGHTVALHTSTHNYSYLYSSPSAYFEDLEAVHTRVKNITGYDSRIIRFPGGSSNTISRRYSEGIMSYLTKEVLNRGYRYFDWNISSGDAGSTTDSNVVYQNVVSHLSHERTNMVLMHDIKPYTRDALRQIIKYGKENGFVFDKITDNTEMITQRVNN